MVVTTADNREISLTSPTLSDALGNSSFRSQNVHAQLCMHVYIVGGKSPRMGHPPTTAGRRPVMQCELRIECEFGCRLIRSGVAGMLGPLFYERPGVRSALVREVAQATYLASVSKRRNRHRQSPLPCPHTPSQVRHVSGTCPRSPAQQTSVRLAQASIPSWLPSPDFTTKQDRRLPGRGRSDPQHLRDPSGYGGGPADRPPGIDPSSTSSK